MALWRHLANTIEVVLPLAHLGLLPKLQIDRLSHFCTVYVRVSAGTSGMLFPIKIAHSRGGSVLPSNTWFLGSTRLTIPNGVSIGSAVSAQLKAESPLLYNGRRCGLLPSQTTCYYYIRIGF